MLRLRPWLLILSGLSLTSCDGDGDSAKDCRPLRSACDISQAKCQAEVFRATACERDQRDAKLPKVRVITRAELREELESEVAASEPSAQMQAWERACQMIDFLPRDQGTDQASIELVVDGIAAYYSSYSKDITVIDDAAQAPEDGTFTLSHEFMHALQDQRDGFSKLHRSYADSTDSVLALDALTEGEATLLSNAVMLRSEGMEEPYSVNFDSYFDKMRDLFLSDIAQSAAPLLSATQTLSYPLGGKTLARIAAEQGLAGIEARYDSPYTTLSSFIHKPGGSAILGCDLPVAPEGHKLVVYDRLGAAGLLALDVVTGQGFEAFIEAPERWMGDSIAVFASPEETPLSVAMAWRIQLATQADAKELAQNVSLTFGERLSVAQDGREVLLSNADSADVRASWDASQCAPEKSRSPLSRKPKGLLERLGIVH